MNFSEIVIFVITGIIIFLMLSGFIISFLYVHKNSQMKNLQEKLMLETQFSQTLLQTQLEIQEQTLQQISNELHDNIAQVASLIKMSLYTIKLNDTVKAEQKLEDIKELTRQLIGDIKSLSINFNGDRIAQI